MRLHDLRHSYASRALALGESLPMIGKLLGHSKIETTARYAHLARDSVQESAARIADSIAADILGGAVETGCRALHQLIKTMSQDDPLELIKMRRHLGGSHHEFMRMK